MALGYRSAQQDLQNPMGPRAVGPGARAIADLRRLPGCLLL
jgi:hypothetical protein